MADGAIAESAPAASAPTAMISRNSTSLAQLAFTTSGRRAMLWRSSRTTQNVAVPARIQRITERYGGRAHPSRFRDRRSEAQTQVPERRVLVPWARMYEWSALSPNSGLIELERL